MRSLGPVSISEISMPCQKEQNEESSYSITPVVIAAAYFSVVLGVIYSLYSNIVPIENRVFYSKAPADWGVFGDLVGGVLNPLVALFALVMLIKSVQIQRRELAETRKELSESKKAQEEMAKHQLMAAKIAAFTVLYQHYRHSEVVTRDKAESIEPAGTYAGKDGEVISGHEVRADLNKLAWRFQELRKV
jgi:large-conductance mechanosensitive channel